ncbi:hypothetical protein RAY_12 [Erwinia phage vB_EamM_RAY]|uniref:Uncharacterized protein n=5 Tax=Agricanvirus TaxID=1984776 RepID=A0A173GDZ9_9CAUD|nr:hypothetical protein FDH98_gp012 [Erwinia phage vB_EamM_RAY]ANH51793.2 hypothetical protein RAY_12 [Erwinia phage vB_EamM_RAY]AUG85800.1 hypothetical protein BOSOLAPHORUS_12 [Erwinia phage vB_EamM_Bosolaphorus]AUG86761.1 hypothetical protein MORTIMER_12 [Erwinia phage vB_EamM_Mortimer]
MKGGASALPLGSLMMVLQDGRPVEELLQVSIDPGTDTVGVTLLGLHPITLEMTWKESFTLYGSLLNYRSELVFQEDRNRDARLKGLTDALLRYLCTVRPHVVVFEDNFLRHSPQAFKALIESVEAIKRAVWGYNPYLPFYEISPMQAKGAVNAIAPRGQKHDKELVRKGLMNYPRLQIPHAILQTLSEHAVDSVAIGIYGLEQLSLALSAAHWR